MGLRSSRKMSPHRIFVFRSVPLLSSSPPAYPALCELSRTLSSRTQEEHRSLSLYITFMMFIPRMDASARER